MHWIQAAATATMFAKVFQRRKSMTTELAGLAPIIGMRSRPHATRQHTVTYVPSCNVQRIGAHALCLAIHSTARLRACARQA